MSHWDWFAAGMTAGLVLALLLLLFGMFLNKYSR